MQLRWPETVQCNLVPDGFRTVRSPLSDERSMQGHSGQHRDGEGAPGQKHRSKPRMRRILGESVQAPTTCLQALLSTTVSLPVSQLTKIIALTRKGKVGIK